MKNYVQSGDVVTISASADTSSGDVVVEGSLIGVAQADALTGEDLAIVTKGVFELSKTSAQAWALGVPIYVTSAGLATTASSGNTLVGVAVAAAANPSDTGMVRLNG
jgi:predicted RecA/RadA family phage recombinase